jgi:phage nucleotide-binding protein
MNITKTNELINAYINCLVYSRAGVGKTYLSLTAPKPFIVSIEGGLLSLNSDSIDFKEIQSYKELQDVYKWLKGPEGNKYETICVDSLSEIAELILTDVKDELGYKKLSQEDNRKIYPAVYERTANIIRAFRNLPKNVYFTATQSTVKDDRNVVQYIPAMPGSKLTDKLPYFFDIVMCLRKEKREDGTFYRYLQTQPSLHRRVVKYRAGRGVELEPKEDADLTKIFNKLTKKEDLK